MITTQAPLPSLEPDMLLLKNIAVAVKPIDVKLTGPMASEGATAGSDCAGIVVAVGRDVPKHRFAPGERAFAPLPAMDPLVPQIGAFSEYLGVWSDFALKEPHNMSLESAAALGIGAVTIGDALFRSLNGLAPCHISRSCIRNSLRNCRSRGRLEKWSRRHRGPHQP